MFCTPSTPRAESTLKSKNLKTEILEGTKGPMVWMQLNRNYVVRLELAPTALSPDKLSLADAYEMLHHPILSLTIYFNPITSSWNLQNEKCPKMEKKITTTKPLLGVECSSQAQICISNDFCLVFVRSVPASDFPKSDLCLSEGFPWEIGLSL